MGPLGLVEHLLELAVGRAPAACRTRAGAASPRPWLRPRPGVGTGPATGFGLGELRQDLVGGA
eukprot:4581164-Heterocapsa_arctica.AAC.1